MPNRTDANLVKAQAKLLAKFQSSELRFRFPATYLAFKTSTPIMFPNYVELRGREDRVIETNYKARTSRALGLGGRTHNHTGPKGDTALMTPAWSTYDDKFNISLKQADNSLYNLQEQLQSELENIVANFAEGYETLATNYVFANRSGVNIDTSGEGIFNGANQSFEITEATEGDRSIQITKSVMHSNKYTGGYVVFCDTKSFNKFEADAAQGAGNSTNLSFQFNNVTYVHSVELGALAAGLGYTKGFWVAVEPGTFGVLPWVPKQNRMGVNTKVNQYSLISNPVDGESYAVHTYEDRADDTANNGYTQDVVTQYEISQDISFVHAPLTTANETTFQAFSLV